MTDKPKIRHKRSDSIYLLRLNKRLSQNDSAQFDHSREWHPCPQCGSALERKKIQVDPNMSTAYEHGDQSKALRLVPAPSGIDLYPHIADYHPSTTIPGGLLITSRLSAWILASMILGVETAPISLFCSKAGYSQRMAKSFLKTTLINNNNELYLSTTS